MAGKKTGLYLSPLAEEIVNEVAKKFGYTKVSNTVNYIILEYSKLIKQDKQEVVEVKEPEAQIKQDLSKTIVFPPKKYIKKGVF